MVTGHVRNMQLRDPRKVKIIYERPRWSEVWDNNPRIAKKGEQGDFQEYTPRVGGLRPYCSAKTEDKWTWKEYQPPVGELHFDQVERNFGKLNGGHVIIEPNVKRSASPNKDWGWERWQHLVDKLHAAGIVPHQLGPRGANIIGGARHIETPSFRYACAVLSQSRAAIVSEGGLHHAAAAVGLKAVVIFGGFISPKQTGYDMHVNLFTGGEPCGNRKDCGHCKEAMAKISPDMVFEAAKGIL